MRKVKDSNLSLSRLQRDEEITRLENKKMESLKENCKLPDKQVQLLKTKINVQKQLNNFKKTHREVLSIQHELAFLKVVYGDVREKNGWRLVIHLYIDQVEDNMECHQNIQILVQKVLLEVILGRGAGNGGGDDNRSYSGTTGVSHPHITD